MSPLDAAQPFASALIAKKARALARSRGFRPHEEQDIAQELWAELSRKAPRYRPESAKPTTYVGMIIRRKVIDLARDRKALKRDGGAMRRLDGLAAEGPALVEDSVRRTHRGVSNREPIECGQMKIDMDGFIGSLPIEAQDLCHRFFETGKFGAVAGTKAQQLLQLIRERAVAAGLGGYLVEGADGVEDEAELQPAATAAQGRRSA